MPELHEKVEIYPYSEDFPRLFEKKKEEILNLYQDCEIHHIGSTAVPGLGGKGIIDVLIAMDNWEKEDGILKALRELGYNHTHEREDGRRFVSKKPSEVGYKDFHIHIVKKNNSQYEDLLSFRDYLRNNPNEAKKYFKLKKKAKGLPLSVYRKGKNEFFKRVKNN